jgi:hypothetical protein
MKLLSVLFSLVILSSVTFSDQLAWISKSQAETTVAYFEDNDIKQVILWCACCDDDPKVLVNVINVSFRPTESGGYYEVYIEGNSVYGKVNQAVDLAYVHIQKGKKWYCLGKQLGFECDPCTKSFKY